jgi:hypothetical protein
MGPMAEAVMAEVAAPAQVEAAADPPVAAVEEADPPVAVVEAEADPPAVVAVKAAGAEPPSRWEARVWMWLPAEAGVPAAYWSGAGWLSGPAHRRRDSRLLLATV